MKYVYRIIVSTKTGIGATTISRNTKVETLTQFNELENYIKKTTPEFGDTMFILNLILLKNK